MHRQSHPYQRLVAHTAIGFLLCLGGQGAFAAGGGQATAQTGDVTAKTAAKHPKREAVRAKVTEARIHTKPQRPVKQLTQK